MAVRRRCRAYRLAIVVGMGILPAVAACGGSGTDAPIELPAEEVSLSEEDASIELPAQEVFPGEGSAMLKIDRTFEYPLALLEMNADFTVQTLHGLVGEPGQTNKVFGSTEVEFAGSLTGQGTGGEHTTTATGPVKYEVDGFFYPASGGCTFELVVTETLRLSQVASMENTALGVIPVPPGGLGDDVVTTFDVEFDEESLDFFIIAGEHTSAFTLYDIALPDGTDCRFTG